ncbi:MAG: hypothetical protein ACLTER_17710 [Ruminococcus sp.]
MVKAGIDDSAIIGFQETKHDAKGEVDWDNDTTKLMLSRRCSKEK